MYDNNQNSIQMTGQQTKSNGQNGINNQANNNNNSIVINQNLKNDHIVNGMTNGNPLLQKQIQQHPQQLLQQQQQQIQQVTQQYSQNDLEELTNPEISLDLANFIDDQFRSEQEQFAFFNKVVPAVGNGVNGVVNGVNVNGIVQSEAAKALQQARFQHRQNPGNALAYMPGCVTGWWKNLFPLLRMPLWVWVNHQGFLVAFYRESSWFKLNINTFKWKLLSWPISGILETVFFVAFGKLN